MNCSDEEKAFLYEVSGGIPGSIKVLCAFIKPNVSGTIDDLRRLKEIGFVGSDYWILHKYVLKENMIHTLIVMMNLAIADNPENYIFHGEKPILTLMRENGWNKDKSSDKTEEKEC